MPLILKYLSYGIYSLLPHLNHIWSRSSHYSSCSSFFFFFFFLQILVIMGTMISLFYMWLYSQSFHFHVAHVYARFGYSSAQLIVGQRYLKGSFFVPLVLILPGTGWEATCSLDFCICRFIEDFSTKQLTDSPPPFFFLLFGFIPRSWCGEGWRNGNALV